MRLPSGAIAAPWFTSIPSISPITLFVSGSMTWTLSPALLVCTITTLFAAAAGDAVHVHTANVLTAARHQRDAYPVIIVHSSSFRP